MGGLPSAVLLWRLCWKYGARAVCGENAFCQGPGMILLSCDKRGETANPGRY